MTAMEKVNKAMSGQKKIGASVYLPIIAVLINSIFADPTEAEGIMEVVRMYLPSIILTVSGWFYTTREASVDKERAKEKVAVEQTKQLEIQRQPLPPMTKPKPVDFKAFLARATKRAKVDANGMPLAEGLYYALITEGRRQEVELYLDAWKYANLMVDAAEKKFEATHGFSLDDPDLAHILRTKGKCPYSSVDAYCAYEGDEVDLDDVADAKRKRDCFHEAVQLDITGDWRTSYDTSLYGLYTIAEVLLRNQEAKGR